MSTEPGRFTLLTSRIKGAMHIPGSIPAPCTKCGEPCWVSPTSIPMLAAADVVCMQCGLPEIQKQTNVKFHSIPGQAKELVDAMETLDDDTE